MDYVMIDSLNYNKNTIYFDQYTFSFINVHDLIVIHINYDMLTLIKCTSIHMFKIIL